MRRWKWAQSMPDFLSHAIDRGAEHPWGVLKAACGHTLPISVALSNEPHSTRCPDCVRQYGADLLCAMVELVERLEAEGLTSELVDRLRLLARQARQVQLSALVNQWIAEQRSAADPPSTSHPRAKEQ